MNLYKYLPPERVDIIENLKIRFTQTAVLNDPFESFPGTAVTKPKEYYQNKFEEKIKEELAQNPFLRDVERKRVFRDKKKLFPKYYHNCTDKNRLENIAYEIQKMSSTVSGILSLSQNCDNILMWSHYTNSHKGFVIEFDHKHEFFNKYVHSVIYTDKRPEIDLTESKQSGELFYTKSKDWAYEEEVRMSQYFVAPLKMKNGNDFLPYTINDSKQPVDESIKLFDIPKESIKSIIFGWKIEQELIERIINIVDYKEMTWVHFFNATPHDRLFKMNITKYKKT